MTETRPVQSAQPSTDATSRAPDRRHPRADTIARFSQALSDPSSGLLKPMKSPAQLTGDHTSAAEGDERTNAWQRDPNASTPGHQDSHAAASTDAERGDANTSTASDGERRDVNPSAPALPATVGSLYYSLPVIQTTPDLPTAAGNNETARLIEQATSVLMERASRADSSRFIVSLDHSIVGGASAEFIRDGAFLRVRLLARNDAAYRSMWTNRVELEERLAASTGLVTRVEISEGYGDGRPA